MRASCKIRNTDSLTVAARKIRRGLNCAIGCKIKAEGISVEEYVERIALDEQRAWDELEALLLRESILAKALRVTMNIGRKCIAAFRRNTEKLLQNERLLFGQASSYAGC